jgi:hypothetical protein
MDQPALYLSYNSLLLFCLLISTFLLGNNIRQMDYLSQVHKPNELAFEHTLTFQITHLISKPAHLYT